MNTSDAVNAETPEPQAMCMECGEAVALVDAHWRHETTGGHAAIPWLVGAAELDVRAAELESLLRQIVQAWEGDHLNAVEALIELATEALGLE